MSRFRKGQWVTYRSGGLSHTKLILAIKPDGTLVVGEHENDPDTHTVDPEYTDVSRA